MKIKFSKIKQYKLITGEHFLSAQKRISNTDSDTFFDDLERFTLGLFLMDTHGSDVKTARSEYVRLLKPENDDERFDIVDTVNIKDLVSLVAEK